MESDEDHHGPSAATRVEQGTTRTFSLGACGGWFAGTLDRCPVGVRRSIGQSAVQCQKQNGTLSGASCGSSGRALPHSTMLAFPMLHFSEHSWTVPANSSRKYFTLNGL